MDLKFEFCDQKYSLYMCKMGLSANAILLEGHTEGVCVSARLPCGRRRHGFTNS